MVLKNRVVFINRHYSWLSDFIVGIPSIFEGEGELIRDKRNVIKRFHLDGKCINVKQFCIPPYFWNRIVYCYFREPKALRAYTNAVKLQELGVGTPTPIAYMLFKKRGILSKCYFVSEQLCYDNNIHDVIIDREIDERAAQRNNRAGGKDVCQRGDQVGTYGRYRPRGRYLEAYPLRDIR